MRPYPPIKPNTIPQNDYSYAINYAEYKVKEIMKKNDLPSISVALIDDQDIIMQNSYGYANLEENILATPETVYRMGSVAKVFTAMEIMRLYNEGLVDLDAPITDYIPDFSIKSRFQDNTSITIRSLLTHRSGLPRNGNLPYWYFDSGVNILRDYVSSLKHSSLAFPTGYRFKYSNIAYNILGRIIEILRPSIFPFYMRDDLLREIGMNQSSFLSIDVAPTDDIAVGYYNENGKNHPIEHSDIISFASGNLYSSLQDMAEFTRFVFRGGKTGSTQIIANETLQLMFEEQPSQPRDTQTMGLGWFTGKVKNTEKVVFHGGDGDGVHSIVALLPERKLGVVLIGNSVEFSTPINYFAWEILEIMLETKYGIILQDDSSYTAIDIDSSLLANYTGKYVVENDIIEVFLKGTNKLKINALGFDMDLIPVSNSKFRVKHWLLDFGRFDVEFFPSTEIEDKFLKVTLEGAAQFYAPSYPEENEISSFSQNFFGVYDSYPSNSSIYFTGDTLGRYELTMEDGILKLGSNFILKPISETEIIILSGAFVGETMTYDESTKSIYWSSYIYTQVES
ncbi:MAG: beta-lactamase family protein [Candidatus Heimdallarchaeota archaeon]|nr:beta-lactamase family protein [Candidatus Heimdallarchaeota archaeon]MBY8994743.1 beta-lactamase family protein [Candidatus Heimdallarchaeota archaeon]